MVVYTLQIVVVTKSGFVSFARVNSSKLWEKSAWSLCTLLLSINHRIKSTKIQEYRWGRYILTTTTYVRWVHLYQGGGLKVEKSGYDTCALNTVCKMRCYTKNPVSVGEVHSHNHNLRSVSSSVPGEGVIVMRRILEEGLIVDQFMRFTCTPEHIKENYSIIQLSLVVQRSNFTFE